MSELTGVRHERADGRVCGCGCSDVAGLPGRIVRNSDTPKLLAMDPPGLVAEFDVPCPAGGPVRTEQVFYELSDLPESRDLLGECPRCGQQSPGVFERCARCVAADRADQGTQDRLFTPTAAPIPGQQTL